MKILKEPFSDNDLHYNEETGRYELTPEYVKNTFEIPYKSDKVLLKRIKETSRLVYHWIFAHSNTANRQVINFLIHRTKNGRTFIKEAMDAQIAADIKTGYNDIANTPVINVSTGQEGNRAVYRENMIAITTENIIEDSASYFEGISIVYQAAYPAQLFIFVANNSKEN